MALLPSCNAAQLFNLDLLRFTQISFSLNCFELPIGREENATGRHFGKPEIISRGTVCPGSDHSVLFHASEPRQTRTKGSTPYANR